MNSASLRFVPKKDLKDKGIESEFEHIPAVLAKLEALLPVSDTKTKTLLVKLKSAFQRENEEKELQIKFKTDKKAEAEKK